MKASDLFVAALEKEGVQYIFGVPGEENLDFLESLRTSKIKLIITRHEQAAGFMAATVGRLTGKAGVALSTLGPGATNFVTAAAYAQLGGMPTLFITGQKPVKKSKQGRFQMVDTVDIFSSITNFSHQIVDGQTIPGLVREAFAKAESERPGAVHLELPEDVAKEPTEANLESTKPTQALLADSQAIFQAVSMIEQAKQPLLVIGAAASRHLTAKVLQELVDKTGIYFITTQMGKGVIDERHELYLGTTALSANDYVHCALDKADVIITIGHDTIEKPPFIMDASDKRQVVHINFSAATSDKIYFPKLEVVGDVAHTISQITEKITKQPHWDNSYFNQVKEISEEALVVDHSLRRFPLTPQAIVEDVRSVMPDDGIVCLDNGMYKLWFARQYKAYQPHALLLDNALATMGVGLPSAIAAKLVYPDRKVIAVCGDGGFMMNSQELETALRLKLDLVVVIVNDNAYGMIKWKQQADNLTSFGLDYNNPDFVKYAKSYGAHGVKIKNAKQFPKVLQQALNKKGVTIIEVPIDYSENHRVLTEELKNKSCPA